MLLRGGTFGGHAAGARLAALALLAGLVGFAWWAFRAAGQDYWEFWLKSGPVIGLATAAIGWAWGGLDRNPGLVSADPLGYLGAALQVLGVPIYAFGGHMLRENRGARAPLWDTLLVLPLAMLFAIAMLGWLLLIAPAQYFVFLFAGAPSRIALASRYRLYARLRDGQLEYVGKCDLDKRDYPKEDGWWDASMRDRPVTIASAFMAAALVVINIQA